MFEIEKEVVSSTSHQLREVEHEKSKGCLNVHGHNWHIRVSVSGNDLKDSGMLVDFSFLKAIMMQFDHGHLNDHHYFQHLNPTAENLARFLFGQIKSALPVAVEINWIKIWETESSMVKYYE